MSKRAKEAALKVYPDGVFRYRKIGDADGVMTGESVESQQYIRDYFLEGYEQAQKDTIERAWEWMTSAKGEHTFEDFCKAMEE